MKETENSGRRQQAATAPAGESCGNNLLSWLRFDSHVPVFIYVETAVLIDRHTTDFLLTLKVHMSQFDRTLESSPPPG
jgi:hypothetical protein